MNATRFALLCALSLAFVTGAQASTKATTKKVNFVMLFVDDLGYGDVGFTGHPSPVKILQRTFLD